MYRISGDMTFPDEDDAPTEFCQSSFHSNVATPILINLVSPVSTARLWDMSDPAASMAMPETAMD